MTNPIELMYEKNPLMRFSAFTHVSVLTLNNLSREIFVKLDELLATPGHADGSALNEVFGNFWLWVIGSYEVTRTMCQAKACFSAQTADNICNYKRELAALRMPFAKQEYASREIPTGIDAFISGLDFESRDIKFIINGKLITARNLINNFNEIINTIKLADVVADHRASYAK